MSWRRFKTLIDGATDIKLDRMKNTTLSCTGASVGAAARGRIHNTSFSSQHTNETNKQGCSSLASVSGVGGSKCLAYWAHT
jgi:hypothetical protein